jgi:predicted Fe-Mo cluster-binding NifX family protein
MKIAISSSGDTLTSEVDPRFGRCRCFIIYDDKSLEFEVLNNAAQSASGGAGVEAAQTIANSGAEIVLTGNVGPNAFQALKAAELPVFLGARGSIKETIQKYQAGDLDSPSGPSVSSHFGMR